MKFLTEKELLIIRGKAMVGRATTKEILSVFGHLDAIEEKLEEASYDDFFGTEGWRRWIGLPDWEK